MKGSVFADFENYLVCFKSLGSGDFCYCHRKAYTHTSVILNDSKELQRNSTSVPVIFNLPG